MRVRSKAADRARDAYSAVEDEWREFTDRQQQPRHQVGGWPQLQQAPIWRECDLVSRGHPLGTSEELKVAQLHRHSEREAAWSLLLQLDTDDHIGWMWGDAGIIYFAAFPPVNQESLSWTVLQCG